MPNPLRSLFAAPLLRRIGFHARRITSQMDRHFFTSLLTAVIGFVVVASLGVTLLENEKQSIAGFGSSFYWAITTVIGSGDPSYVNSPGGFVIGWFLAFFGVAIVAAMTGAVVGFVIDFLLKEGQGMGAAGYADHIVICGWNSTARDLVDELKQDEYTAKIVLVHDADRNPAGGDVYYVRGDATHSDDLERAGIEHAMAAVVFPVDGSDAA
ncbi:MAG TPA: NAD-binding protein, partial [Candidatus Limnocylindria bacterium]